MEVEKEDVFKTYIIEVKFKRPNEKKRKHNCRPQVLMQALKLRDRLLAFINF